MVVEQDSDADYRTHGGLIIFPNMYERIQIEDAKIFYSFALLPVPFAIPSCYQFFRGYSSGAKSKYIRKHVTKYVYVYTV